MQQTVILFGVAISLLIAGLLIAVVYYLRNNTRNLIELNNKLQPPESKEKVRFNTQKAEDWFEKGDLAALNKYCERFIADSPNSVHANWYFGLSYYSQGHYELAKNYFEEVIRINPLWRDGAIVYLQEIADKVESSHHQTLH